MPLGSQFSNTYWEDPNTKKVMSSSERGVAQRTYKDNAQYKDNVQSYVGRAPLIQEGFSDVQNPQGMLFDPYSYTGLKKDPTVSPERRRAAIDKALNLKTQEQYAEITPRKTVGGKKLESPATRAAKADAFRTAADSLDISTQQFEKEIDAPVKAANWGKGYASFTGGIAVGIRPNVTVEKTTEQRIIPSEKAIRNDKFWSQYDKATRGHSVHTILMEDDLEWSTPEGRVIKGKDIEDEIAKEQGLPEDQKGKWGWGITEEEQMGWLSHNNFAPNVFPGKGGSGNKKAAVGGIVKIETGYHPSGSGYTEQSWHTRFVPDTSKPAEEITTKKVKREGFEANASTLAHEIGHTFENFGSMYRKPNIAADPFSEGHADAFDDRAFRYAGQFEKHLSNLETRTQDIKRTGYSTQYKNWNNREKALYAAVRYHLAANPDAYKEFSNRDPLVERYEFAPERKRTIYNNDVAHSQTILLGHIYEKAPEVRALLKNLGFDELAKKAHADYMSRIPSSNTQGARRRPELPEQETLF